MDAAENLARAPVAELPETLDRSGRLAIVVLSVVCSAALLTVRDGREYGWWLFDGARALTVWHTLLIGPAVVTALLLRQARDYSAWCCGVILAALLLPLALHAGGACTVAGVNIDCGQLMAPYVLCLCVLLSMLAPFLQAWRDSGRLDYILLYRYAWDNNLALAAALFFTGAGWAILALWAALFDVVGIKFFEELFHSRRFAYPTSGLLLGYGLAMGRTQQGAIRAMLRICLATGRAQLPLIAVLALSFLTALIFTGLEPLWATRHAAALLLVLVFWVVTMLNAVYQDGVEAPDYPHWSRRLATAALLSLPVYAGLAAYALKLRVTQYGWTVDRLWAAVVTAVALAYAFSYALAAMRRSTPWLQGVASANRAIALGVIFILFLTQSPVLDFRVIAIHSQMQRLKDGQLRPEEFDLRYLRWDLGAPGVMALQALQDDPRFSTPLLNNEIKALLAADNPWNGGDERLALPVERIPVLAGGPQVPEALKATLAADLRRDQAWGLEACRTKPDGCVFAAADLDGDGEVEWVLMSKNPGPWDRWPVFARHGERYARIAMMTLAGNVARTGKSVQIEPGNPVRTQPARWQELYIGPHRFYVQEPQPHEGPDAVD